MKRISAEDALKHPWFGLKFSTSIQERMHKYCTGSSFDLVRIKPEFKMTSFEPLLLTKEDLISKLSKTPILKNLRLSDSSEKLMQWKEFENLENINDDAEFNEDEINENAYELHIPK